MTYRNIASLFLLLLALPARGADLPGSQDPPGMKRYAASEIIGYRAAKFDEFLLPLGRPTSVAPKAGNGPRPMSGSSRTTSAVDEAHW